MSWESVIGLELHVQLATDSKIFSGAATAYGAYQNSQACAVDLGLPGVLPVLNGKAVEMAVLFGLAIKADVAETSVFARKNYFYPDLPKGYQISQYEQPIVAGGEIAISLGGRLCKTINITRAHLEEDAGKSLHEGFHKLSGIDLNRAGTPLLEIVSEPEMRSAAEAVAYMRAIHTLVRYLGICDGNMQEGSFRCDANVSVRPSGQTGYGTRTEIKNLNSFRFVERAIDYEIERQIDVLETGGKIVQETRLYDADRDVTRSMRSKEDAHDYRYFPEPDLLPLKLSVEYVARLKQQLPELPWEKQARFIATYGLGIDDAAVLTQDRSVADYYEEAVRAAGGEPKTVANWVIGELFGAMNHSAIGVGESPVSPSALGTLVRRIKDQTISGKIAKQVFEAMWAGEGDPDQLIEARSLHQLTDSHEIETMVEQVIADSPAQVEQYMAGKDKVLGYFVGQIMKISRGKANPELVNELLRARLRR